MRGAIRAFLAVLLLALFPFFVAALGVAGVLCGLAAGGRVSIYLLIVTGGLVLALGFALVQAMRTRLMSPSGPRLHRHEQPGLWRLVDELSAKAETRPPDEIVLVPELNAAVREDSRMLGLLPGMRYMMIGLPLLAGLNVSELRSVLAHEIGHYGGGHTRLAAVSYRGAETLGHTVSRLDPGIPRWILIAYSSVYAVLSRSANQAQEVQADAYSVAVAGRGTAASALCKTATMEAAWSAFAERYLPLPALAGRTADILLGFRSFLDHPTQRQALAELERKVLDNEPRSLLDSHPTIRRRITAMKDVPNSPALPDQRPAWFLLADPGRVVPAAEAQLLVSGDLGPRASWAEIARRAGAADAARGAERLARAAHESGAASRGTLGEILRAVQRGEANRIVRPLLREAASKEEQQRAASEGLARLIGDVIVSALITKGLARHELDWGQGWQVIGPTGELKPAELAQPVIDDPTLVPGFAKHLMAFGVPMDFVRPPSSQPRQRAQAGEADPRLVAVAPEVAVFRKNWDVLVHDIGLLLVPLKVGRLLRQNLASVLGLARHSQRKRLTQLVEQTFAQLFNRPGVRWLAADTMLGGDRKKFLTGGGKVALRLTDGQTATLRTKSDSAYQALAEFLDGVQQAAPATR